MRTENMNISYRKFRRMHGRIVLLTIFGLLIADIQAAPNVQRDLFLRDENEPEETNFIEDLNITQQYFSNEKEVILERISTIFEINKESSTFIRNTGGNHPQNNLLALAHGTLLAFWAAIDFKICYLIFATFEDTQNEEYGTQKQTCEIYFEEMYFIFQEFKKRIYSMRFILRINKEMKSHLYQGNDAANQTVHEVLTLSLDFILSLSKLTKKENGPDEQMSGFIDWSSVRTSRKHGKNYKTLFPSVKYVRMHYKTENMTIEGMYNNLCLLVKKKTNSAVRRRVYHFLNQQLLQNPDNNRVYFWEIFYRLRYDMKVLFYTYLRNECTIDLQAEGMERIRQAIRVIALIRIFHCSTLVEYFTQFNALAERIDNDTR